VTLRAAAAEPLSERPDGLSAQTSALFLEAARAHSAQFEVVSCENGLELRRCASQGEPPARTFLKVCSVRPAHTVVFFFKRSILPFSRDRYSYGGCEWPDAQLRPEYARESLDFLASGLGAASRPVWLRRSLPFSLPD
jgi:hypothetical protein